MKLPFPYRLLLWLAALVVPRRIRQEWRREWEGEISYGLRRKGGRTPAAGAFPDALWLFGREMREGLLLDVRHGMRQMARRPAASAVIILTMALGLGAATVVFGVVDAALLRPLPYPQADRLVNLWETNAREGDRREMPSPGNYQEWTRRNQALPAASRMFENLAAWSTTFVTFQDGRDAEEVATTTVSPGFFETLGVRPLLGRVFTGAESDRATFNSANIPTGRDPVVMLSHGFWLRRFGGDAEIVGRTIILERQPWKVIGIMPPGFAMPSPETELWIPRSYASDRPRDQHWQRVVARLRSGVSVEQAGAWLSSVAGDLARQFPDTNQGWGTRVVSFAEDHTGEVKPALAVLSSAVGLVLLIACANVAGVLLARVIERRREWAVRLAVGASRARVMRQMLVESLLYSLAGGAGGLLLTSWMLPLAKTLRPESLPNVQAVTLDVRIFAFALALAALSAALAGAVPAWLSSRAAPGAALLEFGRSIAGARGRARGALVAGEVALAITLLTGAGLLLRTFLNLRAVDTGFTPQEVMVLRIQLDVDTGAKSRDYYQRLMAHLRSLPYVTAAGGVTAMPLNPVGSDFDRPWWREGDLPAPGGTERADVRMATPGYFQAMGMRVLRGRAFMEGDTQGAPLVGIINESLARRAFPNQDPLGKRLVLGYGGSGPDPALEVVGVVNDIHHHGPRRDPRPEVYRAHAQNPYLMMNIAVRTNGDPERWAETLRREALSVPPGQPVHSAVSMRQLVAASLERDRFAMVVLGSFAAVAVGLAALGIYGLLAQVVGERTTEIGVRLALGARQQEILALMIGRGMKLVGTGVAAGMAISAAVSRWLEQLLFETPRLDPLTYAGGLAVLAAAALAACYLPARRAARLDPQAALRHH